MPVSGLPTCVTKQVDSRQSSLDQRVNSTWERSWRAQRENEDMKLILISNI